VRPFEPTPPIHSNRPNCWCESRSILLKGLTSSAAKSGFLPRWCGVGGRGQRRWKRKAGRVKDTLASSSPLNRHVPNERPQTCQSHVPNQPNPNSITIITKPTPSIQMGSQNVRVLSQRVKITSTSQTKTTSRRMG